MRILHYDYIVIGSGLAGLNCALNLSEIGSVAIITKSSITESNTKLAQGGIATVISNVDNFENHAEDTLKAGCEIGSIEAINILVSNGPKCIEQLAERGIEFDKVNGEYLLGKEGAHSHSRVLHSVDKTGLEIESKLVARVYESGNIDVFEHSVAIDLITGEDLIIKQDSDTIFGAYIYHKKSEQISSVIASATILATGGGGNVYASTTNSKIATGDGYAMAYRKGAVLSNMEFVQFHPTAFYSGEKGRTFLISEALRGAGAILRTAKNEAFMERYHKLKDLAPRDVVARAIDTEIKSSSIKHVWLDATTIDREILKTEFPGIYDYCASKGIDISKSYIPVRPAAHYFCGGIKTDTFGKTNLQNLFAIGETAHTGVHGANRLASNSLLEAVVFSNRVFDYLKDNRSSFDDIDPHHWENVFDKKSDNIFVDYELSSVRDMMSELIGITRSDFRLKKADKRIKILQEEINDLWYTSIINSKLLELRNIITTIDLIVSSAIKRKESRGLHYNSNYPNTRIDFKKDTEITRGTNGN